MKGRHTSIIVNVIPIFSPEEQKQYKEKLIKLLTMYYFYIVRCLDNSLYCGQTNNLQKRIKEHNSDGPRSAKYLTATKPTELVYFEEFETLQLAMKRERQVNLCQEP